MTEQRILRLGTRRSTLAMAQAGLVARTLTELTGHRVELVGVTTHGDVSTAQLTRIGGTGVFVSALRERLLAGVVDLAVHSLKDLPTGRPDGLILAAVPTREDPRDALVTRDGVKLADLPTGARIGTGSPRRAVQLTLLRHDVRPVPLRGNIDTRLGKVHAGEIDAVVVACAGLTRLGRLSEASEIFDCEDMLPAPGQGALAVECRVDDGDLTEMLAAIDDPSSRAAVTAERALLSALEAGCSAPVGAYAAVTADRVQLSAAVFAPDGSRVLRHHGVGDRAAADQLGRDTAARLLRDGARALVVDHRHTSNGNDEQ